MQRKKRFWLAFHWRCLGKLKIVGTAFFRNRLWLPTCSKQSFSKWSEHRTEFPVGHQFCHLIRRSHSLTLKPSANGNLHALHINEQTHTHIYIRHRRANAKLYKCWTIMRAYLNMRYGFFYKVVWNLTHLRYIQLTCEKKTRPCCMPLYTLYLNASYTCTLNTLAFYFLQTKFIQLLC